MSNRAETNSTHAPASLRRKAYSGTALALALAGALIVTGVVPPPGTALAQPVQIDQPVQLPSFADVVEQVSPAVVGIRVRGETRIAIDVPGFDDLPEGSPEERFFRGIPEFQDPVPTTSLGSGFFVSADGYIVTNNHVIDDAQSFTVIMDDGTEFNARLIGSDPLTDLALLKIDADREFIYVEFADDPVRIGDWVVAVGNPFGLDGTVTAGIVSGRERRIGNSAYDDFLQIDAAVNQGNSGGPTFNLSGQVVGVNTAIFSPSGGNVGIAFAVPAEVAVDVIADLRDHGAVLRGWLGVQIQSVTPDIAAALGLDQAGGAIIAAPIAGAPGDRAGIETRDVVLAVNGAAVADSRDLARKIGALDPDTDAVLTIVRDGEEFELSVMLGTMPGNQVAAAVVGPDEPDVEVGLGLQIGVDRNDKVIVTGMNPVGTAAAAGLRQGDIISAVDDVMIDDIEDLQDAVADARETDQEAMLFQILRGDRVMFLAVRPWVSEGPLGPRN